MKEKDLSFDLVFTACLIVFLPSTTWANHQPRFPSSLSVTLVFWQPFSHRHTFHSKSGRISLNGEEIVGRGRPIKRNACETTAPSNDVGKRRRQGCLSIYTVKACPTLRAPLSGTFLQGRKDVVNQCLEFGHTHALCHRKLAPCTVLYCIALYSTVLYRD